MSVRDKVKQFESLNQDESKEQTQGTDIISWHAIFSFLVKGGRDRELRHVYDKAFVDFHFFLF